MPLRALGTFLLVIAGTTVLRSAEASRVTSFRERLQAAATVPGYTVGLAIHDLVTGHEFLVNPDRVFPQGATIRIHLVTELHRQAAAGRLSLDDVRPLPESARTGGFGVLRHLGHGSVSMSLRDYAALMLMVNDNSAANFLTDVLGMDNVNASLVAQGTPQLKFQRRAISRHTAPADLPENEGTPRAAMQALLLIQRGEVVNRATSDAIIEMLALPEAAPFRRDLPPGVRFAGESAGNQIMRCEEGIVLIPGRPYVYCAMYVRSATAGPAGRTVAPDDPLERISRLALDYFVGNRSARPRGR
jgi:beta-lactamase class A